MDIRGKHKCSETHETLTSLQLQNPGRSTSLQYPAAKTHSRLQITWIGRTWRTKL